MNRAQERVPNVPLLINIVSRRVKQLNQGQRPMVKPDSVFMPRMDIALKEVAEGKLTAEIAFATEDEAAEATERVISL